MLHTPIKKKPSPKVEFQTTVALPKETGDVKIDMETGNCIARLGMLLRSNQPSIGPSPDVDYQVFDASNMSEPIWSLQTGGCVALNSVLSSKILALKDKERPEKIVVRLSGPEDEIGEFRCDFSHRVHDAMANRDEFRIQQEGESPFAEDGEIPLEVLRGLTEEAPKSRFLGGFKQLFSINTFPRHLYIPELGMSPKRKTGDSKLRHMLQKVKVDSPAMRLLRQK